MRRLASIVLLAACEPSPDPEPAIAIAIVEPTPREWSPGPARADRQADPTRAALDRECRSCHVDAAHEWQSSQHAGAWSSAAFQRAFVLEPLPFCQSCHAPETSPREPVPSWAAELGVGCVTCHVEPGSPVIQAGDAGEHADELAPHPIARSAAFEQPRTCAACHEFEFPDAALRDRPLAMQATLREHASSSASDRGCVDCHMPIVEGRRSHAFPGAYDPALLGRSLAIAVTRPRPELVRIELRPGEVGHAVPTGDLLRRLEVALVELAPSGERIVARAWLGRRFADRPQSNEVHLREQIADDRVGIGDPVRVVELRVPAEAAGLLRWRVVHERVAQHARDPAAALVEGAIEIAGGPVPTPRSEPRVDP
ncbi:multiheme c-type cytochrome [Nannocystaceae bacterium ST9]